MFYLQTTVTELVVRATVIYVAVFLLFRLFGKKQLGEMSPFDFVLVLIVSESVSNGLSGEEHSLLGGVLSAATLLILSCVVDYFSFKSKKFEKFVEGVPLVIIENGRIHQSVLDKEKITESELASALRAEGVDEIKEVKFAILETNGKITVIKKA